MFEIGHRGEGIDGSEGHAMQPVPTRSAVSFLGRSLYCPRMNLRRGCIAAGRVLATQLPALRCVSSRSAAVSGSGLVQLGF
jgi:hypothetical protein